MSQYSNHSDDEEEEKTTDTRYDHLPVKRSLRLQVESVDLPAE